VHCDDDDNSRALCEVLRRVAVDRAVMAAVSNQNILPMLSQFVDIVKQVATPTTQLLKSFLLSPTPYTPSPSQPQAERLRPGKRRPCRHSRARRRTRMPLVRAALVIPCRSRRASTSAAAPHQVGVPNFLVVALDDRTKSFLDGKGVASYRRSLVARGGGTDNHATSSLKFQILAEMLRVGVSVLLSDVDIVFTQNPFVALYRDTDVEARATQTRPQRTRDGELPVSSTLRSVR
jgi:hypothetical protein